MCRPAVSHRGTVSLSVGWISRIDLCKWTLWSEALSASGNYRLSAFFVSLTLLFLPPQFILRSCSCPKMPVSGCVPAIPVLLPSQCPGFTGKTTNPICTLTKEGLQSPFAMMRVIIVSYYNSSCLLFLFLPVSSAAPPRPPTSSLYSPLESVINITGSSFMLALCVHEHVLFHYIIWDVNLIFFFYVVVLFLAAAVCQLHTLSVCIGMIGIRLWVDTEYSVGYFSAFLKIIVFFLWKLDGIWIHSLSLGVWESIVSLTMLMWGVVGRGRVDGWLGGWVGDEMF